MGNSESGMEYQKVILYIFDLVKQGKLIIGSKIPSEREMATTLGIGRNSTREAISILRGMGFVESVHGSGNYVAKDCDKTIRTMVTAMLALGSITKKDLFEFRKVISQAVSLYVVDSELTDNEKTHLEETLKEMENAKTEDYIRLDQEFHRTLIHSTKNPLFILIMEPIADVYLGLVKDVIENADDATKIELLDIHKNIYKSIINHDSESCLKYVTAHYDIAARISKL